VSTSGFGCGGGVTEAIFSEVPSFAGGGGAAAGGASTAVTGAAGGTGLGSVAGKVAAPGTLALAGFTGFALGRLLSGGRLQRVPLRRWLSTSTMRFLSRLRNADCVRRELIPVARASSVIVIRTSWRRARR
jgi:hypothetical protein